MPKRFRRSGPRLPSMLICQRPYESSGGTALCASGRPPDSASATATAMFRSFPANPCLDAKYLIMLGVSGAELVMTNHLVVLTVMYAIGPCTLLFTAATPIVYVVPG